MSITERIKSFFKEVWLEMRKVSWLNTKEIIRYTIIVLISTFLVAAFLGGLDYLFSTIIKLFIF